ncbi:hypothetical protein K2X92_06195, partial [Candidatus Gracilibacteria bacterium]|nr:hypothetical protein [Candidatus Gracilibacteria bacterium]
RVCHQGRLLDGPTVPPHRYPSISARCIVHDSSKKNRTWREVEYSLDTSDPFVQGILSILSIYMK